MIQSVPKQFPLSAAGDRRTESMGAPSSSPEHAFWSGLSNAANLSDHDPHTGLVGWKDKMVNRTKAGVDEKY